MPPDRHLENVARAHKAWAASRDQTQRAGEKRQQVIRAAHDAGCSLAQIAAVLDVDRSYVWQLCRKEYDGRATDLPTEMRRRRYN